MTRIFVDNMSTFFERFNDPNAEGDEVIGDDSFIQLLELLHEEIIPYLDKVIDFLVTKFVYHSRIVWLVG